MSSRLDQYMSQQNKLQMEQMREEETIFKGITQNTAALTSTMKEEQEASNMYLKVKTQKD